MDFVLVVIFMYVVWNAFCLLSGRMKELSVLKEDRLKGFFCVDWT